MFYKICKSINIFVHIYEMVATYSPPIGFVLTHEVEENVYGYEAGGPLDARGECGNCRKNKTDPQHHSKFIPVHDFGVHCVDVPKNAPLGLREAIVRLVNFEALIVARINVPVISNHRPDKWREGSPYPFCKYRGKTINAGGSGYIDQVIGPINEECQCNTCAGSTEKKTGYWGIGIATARHVIYDKDEAEKAVIFLFDQTPGGKGALLPTGERLPRQMLRGCNFKFEEAVTDADVTRVIFYTHDASWVHMLRDQMICDPSDDKHPWNHMRSLIGLEPESEEESGEDDDDGNDGGERSGHKKGEEVENTDKGLPIRNIDLPFDKMNHTASVTGNGAIPELTIAISHPHSRMMYVSVGKFKGLKLTDQELDDNDKEKVEESKLMCLRHSAPTCPGSSGGKLLTFGRSEENDDMWRYSQGIISTMHSGALNKDIGQGIWDTYWDKINLNMFQSGS